MFMTRSIIVRDAASSLPRQKAWRQRGHVLFPRETWSQRHLVWKEWPHSVVAVCFVICSMQMGHSFDSIVSRDVHKKMWRLRIEIQIHSCVHVVS